MSLFQTPKWLLPSEGVEVLSGEADLERLRAQGQLQTGGQIYTLNGKTAPHPKPSQKGTTILVHYMAQLGALQSHNNIKPEYQLKQTDGEKVGYES